jgi:hypothetical protein
VLASTVDSDGLAFFSAFADHLPEGTITAQTDELITPPKPIQTGVTESDEPGA